MTKICPKSRMEIQPSFPCKLNSPGISCSSLSWKFCLESREQLQCIPDFAQANPRREKSQTQHSSHPTNSPTSKGTSRSSPNSSPEESLHYAKQPYILRRQEILGSAASAGSRYTSWGWRRAGVMARWRHRRLMYCTRATSISRLHLRDAFCACRASMQAHLEGTGQSCSLTLCWTTTPGLGLHLEQKLVPCSSLPFPQAELFQESQCEAKS